jgi:tRNA (guanine-N7-)-methyltransferase
MARGRHPTRLHIDKPDPAVLKKYLRYWYGGDVIREPERFPGLTSPELFGNNNPLEIDFGCGTGVHVCNMAAKNPGLNLLGIDVSQKPIFCGIHDAHARSIDNVKFVRSNFNALLPLLKPETVTTAYYLFPNPPRDYFHLRPNEARKRFLEKIYMSLVSGGRFIFVTDCEPYFECLLKIATAELQYITSPVDIECEGISTWYRSIWEARGMSLMGFVINKL